MMLRSLPALLVLLAGAAGASAQSLKPGLWEITSSLQGGGKEMSAALEKMQKSMAAMPPEQRKMVEDMMAKRGASMGSGGPGASVKICMTKEMAERNEVSTAKGDCTHTASPRVGNTMKYSFQCTQPPASGQGEVTFTSPEAYSMKMSTTSTAGGAERTMDMQSSGRWLDSNCGDVKPITRPTKKG